MTKTKESSKGMVRFNPLEQLTMLEDLSKQNPNQIIDTSRVISYYFMPYSCQYEAKGANRDAMRLYQNGAKVYGIPRRKIKEVQKYLDSLDRNHIKRGYKLVADNKVTMCAHFVKPKKK